MKLPRHIELSIRHNPFAGDYRTAAQWLEGVLERDELDVLPEDRTAILETGEVWEIVWYPDTPVGSCSVAAATLERALALANDGEPAEAVLEPPIAVNLHRAIVDSIPVIESILGLLIGPAEIRPGSIDSVIAAVREFGGGGPEGIERASGRMVEMRQLASIAGDLCAALRLTSFGAPPR